VISISARDDKRFGERLSSAFPGVGKTYVPVFCPLGDNTLAELIS
jgi:hypothetical protein